MGHTTYALIGDVGGTNARFALAEISAEPTIHALAHLPSAEFGSLEAAVSAYLARFVPKLMPSTAVIAVAGPVVNGEVILTNLGWHASETVLQNLGLRPARLVNDFQALAAAAELLEDADLEVIGKPLARDRTATVAVIGAGTGLGISALVREPGKSIALAGEGGHIGFSPEDETEIEILRMLTRRFGRVSTERIVSGPGLVNLYEALCTITGVQSLFTEPPQILEDSERQVGPARDAVERFCAIYGAVAGDIALAFGARGGVLIAGGVSEAMADVLKTSKFRARFEGKGRLSHLVRTIPTHIITRPDAALLGCAKLAQVLTAAETPLP